MDVAARIIDGAVLAVVGFLLAWYGKGKFAALERRIDGVESRLEGRIDGVESRLERRIDGVESRLESRIDGVESRLEGRMDRLEGRITTLQGSLDGVRADLTQVVLALRLPPAAENG